MPVLKHETILIRSEADVVGVRQAVRKWAAELTFSLVDQTKIVTAASELARNTLIHGGGGTARLESLQEGIRRGLRLSGSKRLVSEFEITSRTGEGTRVTVTKWK